MNVTPLIKAFGNIDIYLLDAIMKGHFEGKEAILDAGCGEGRNLTYFLANNYRVSGVDNNSSCIRLCKMMAKSFQPDSDKYDFANSDLGSLPYDSENFDAVICSAVLHFAKSDEDFLRMFKELIRVLKSQGIIFIRMASGIGLKEKYETSNFTFLLSENMLNFLLKEFNLQKLEPVKYVIVEDRREMATLLLRKN